MTLIEKLLGQLHATGTTAQTIYTPGSGIRTIVKSIIVANTANGSVKFSIFFDPSGSTFDNTTAIFKNKIMPAESSDIFDFFGVIENPGTIGVQADTANKLTFTVFGAEVS